MWLLFLPSREGRTDLVVGLLISDERASALDAGGGGSASGEEGTLFNVAVAPPLSGSPSTNAPREKERDCKVLLP